MIINFNYNIIYIKKFELKIITFFKNFNNKIKIISKINHYI